MITEDFTRKPKSSIPEACSNRAATKAVYRFLKSKAIEVKQIQQSMIDATVERIREEEYHAGEVIIIPHDTTEINFSNLEDTEGLGAITNPKNRGMFAHTAMAIKSNGKPFGIVYQEFWERKPKRGKKKANKSIPIEKKESYKWLKAVISIDMIIPRSVKIISTTDRESDLFEYLAQERTENHHILLRARHNRKITNESSEEQWLFDYLEKTEQFQSISIKVSRRKGLQARQLEVEVRYAIVKVMPPGYLKKKYNNKPVSLTAIYIKDSSNKIRWYLLSSIIVKNESEALELVRYYSIRWMIERYHYILKSGTQIEALQLKQAERLEKAIALYSMVAWRIMYITYIARTNPQLSCGEILSEDEWKALWIYTYKTVPEKPPPLSQAVMLIAMLGGFLARKSDGYPGAKVIWKGMKRLSDITSAIDAFKNVGNG